MSIDNLFGKFDSFSAIEHQKKKLIDALKNMHESQLKGTNIDDWVNHFNAEHQIHIPQIKRDKIEGDVNDVQLNARHFRHQFHFSEDDDQFIPTPGTEVLYYVPFEGDKELFNCRGNTIYATFPRAEIGNGKLTFRYQTVEHDANAVNNNFERDLNVIEGHLKSLVAPFEEFNKWIEPTVKNKLAERLEKFTKDAQLASQLKYPLKKRESAPLTYKVPEIKRSAAPRPIPPTKATTAPDPVLEMEHYDHILNVAKNMVRVMECSPKAFKELDEENLRFHFLVQLNGQYEGMATGETFNYQGKTDILIKYNGQNLFVGECKFWKGPKGYTETIDQILKYITWRDTKTAIFMFCKDVDPAIPIQKIPTETLVHPNFLRTVATSDPSVFRYIFKHPGDSSKELILSVLVFNIPI